MSIFEPKTQTTSNTQGKILYSEFNDLVTDDLDYSLSRCFYNYLAGYDDRLPEYSYIDRIVDKTVRPNKDNGTFDSTISNGMGMVIMCKGNNDGRSLSIFQEEPISTKVVRTEIIESDRHTVYKVTPTTIMPVDPDEVPIFREDRILAMQEYLNQYTVRNEITK